MPAKAKTKYKPPVTEVRDLAKALYEGDDPHSNYATICRVSATAKSYYEKLATRALIWMRSNAR